MRFAEAGHEGQIPRGSTSPRKKMLRSLCAPSALFLRAFCAPFISFVAMTGHFRIKGPPLPFLFLLCPFYSSFALFVPPLPFLFLRFISTENILHESRVTAHSILRVIAHSVLFSTIQYVVSPLIQYYSIPFSTIQRHSVLFSTIQYLEETRSVPAENARF